MLTRLFFVLVSIGVVIGDDPLRAAEPATGLQANVAVREATRLDWEFAASGFGKEALKLPADFDSRRQHFQLFVPKNYKADREWPLIVFISPGDDPLGWRYWEKVCTKRDFLFCAPFAAGNNCPAGQRVRIVLDMLDQVRRDYRIDADRTYLTGFSGGGRMACTIAFHLPEFFGGVLPCCGTNPLARLDYLRHRAQDRLSIAFVTGESDFNRAENEKFMAPLTRQVSIRTQLTVVPKLGHGVPDDKVLDAVVSWLEEDLPRRREDIKKNPSLGVPPVESLIATAQAARLLEAAQRDFKEEATVWRGVTKLQGVLARWPRTEAGTKARDLLEELKKDEKRLKLAGDQGGVEERVYLLAQAETLEAIGRTAAALQAWNELAEQHPFAPEGRKAIDRVRKLSAQLANQPYLGIRFRGDSLIVAQVVKGSPADKAGLQDGDRLRRLHETDVATPEELRRALEKVKPGDKVAFGIERKGQKLVVVVEIGSIPGRTSKD